MRAHPGQGAPSADSRCREAPTLDGDGEALLAQAQMSGISIQPRGFVAFMGSLPRRSLSARRQHQYTYPSQTVASVAECYRKCPPLVVDRVIHPADLAVRPWGSVPEADEIVNTLPWSTRVMEPAEAEAFSECLRKAGSTVIVCGSRCSLFDVVPSGAAQGAHPRVSFRKIEITHFNSALGRSVWSPLTIPQPS